ncbi:putative LPS assembly protein LptD [Dokdonia sp. Hel_I_53]|uniref:putative LPS assembly protein LptD n=1 Tax=Dokdonia sp. Hel_I_53 TaxID=1566287 RepID=UPI00119B28BB|nr:putative LPS assembly protein LptD [Dokdonia sp. Hel_I_53]TVZ51094.1 lipopolysaccharide assembly outer membrane protein LptD (OstA) [Dokdonia sp. Hel_I_53]
MQTKTAFFLILIGLCLFTQATALGQDNESNNNAKKDTSTTRVVPAITNDKNPDLKQQSYAKGSLIATRGSSDVATDSLQVAESTPDQDSTRKKQERLTDKVTYKAKDYERISQRLKKIFLYNEAEVVYEDMKINAGEIVLDYQTNTVLAKGIKDSAGNYSQIPVFVQGANEVQPDSIKFNFDTQRALIYGSRVEGAGGQQINLKAERSKRVNDSVVFMSNVKITTAEDLDDPEYYFYARRVKFVPGKKLVAGLTNMYIADVPTPIGIPFAFFPMEKERSVSGFLIPSFNESNERGYSLQNGGYYFALSDYFDLALTGDYYTNGSYAFRADTEYKVRYKFSGRFSFNSERILFSERGLPDFSETNTYNIRWNHSQDTKSSPNSRFSASVNLGSSNFYRQSLNQSNTGNFLNNNFSSSISYSRTFPGVTPINFTVAATHSQNSQTETINMSLPSAQLSIDRIYPFAGKSGSKKGLIDNVNLSYSVNADNRYRTTDSEFFTAAMFEDGQSGIRHNIPIATNFKLFNYISASASANFEESWVFKTIDKNYDERTQTEVIDTINGFDAFRTYRGGLSLGTTVYGTFNFKEGSKIQTIRHVIRPSLSWSYTPAFDQFYTSYERLDPTQIDNTNPETIDVEYSRFDNGFFGAPGNRISNSISLSLANTLEAKVKDRDSTATEPKKIKLINNLNIRTSYNFAADGLKLSPIGINGSIPIIQDKLDINFSAALDLYALNSSNRRIEKLNIQNGGSLFRWTAGQASFGYSFSSRDFEKGGDEPGENTDRTENETFAAGGRPDDLFGKGVDITGNENIGTRDPKEEEEKEVQFYRFKIPWNLRFGYQVGYSNTARQDEITSHSLVVSGDIKLGNRWTVGGSTGYDFANPGITYTSLNFARDLQSWNMRFSWVPPVNANTSRTSWNFFIGISGNLLSDIKYDKRRTPDQRL